MNGSINVKSFDAIYDVMNSMYTFEDELNKNIKKIQLKVSQIIEQIEERKAMWRRTVDEYQNEIRKKQLAMGALLVANCTVPATQLPSVPGYIVILHSISKLKEEQKIANENLNQAKYWLAKIKDYNQDFYDNAKLLSKKISETNPKSKSFLLRKLSELNSYIAEKESSENSNN